MGRLGWSVVLLALSGCTGIDLATVNPPGVNLSGEWVLDFGDSDAAPDLRNDPQSRATRGAFGRGRGSGLAFVVHDFQVLRADKLTIEQNRESMGVRYQPGVYRDLSWGKRQRGLWKVYAGWDGVDLVVVSRANDLEVTERCVSSGQRLTVAVAVEADGEQRQFKRVFNRRR